MISSSVEEVLERLYMAEVEGGEYSPDEKSSAALDRAVADGLAEKRDGRPALTEAGRKAGRDVVRRHRLAECLLRDVLSAGGSHVEEAACRFEHILQHGLDEKVCVLLGHPGQCPHGKAIPEGPCCRKARADGIREVAPLCDGTCGEKGVVAYLGTRENREIQKLMAMGVLPGTGIELIRRSPSFVFQVGYSQFAVDRPLAEIIFVHWNKTRPDPSEVAAPRRRARFGWGRKGPG